jgi:hypothetical protein
MATPPFLPDETKPGDADVVSQYPAVERLFRDIVESWLLVDHDTAGEHAQVTLPELASDPTNATNTGFLYTKDDATDTELYYEDDAGNVVQLTKDGAINVPTGTLDAPTSTSMLFYQDAAPAGWTKDTTTLNDHTLRVVSSTAWSAGSKGNTAFTSVFGAGKVTGGTAISIAQMPAHTHDVRAPDQPNGTLSGFIGIRKTNTTLTDAALTRGGDQAHDHTLSLDVNYINVIRCTKD